MPSTQKRRTQQKVRQIRVLVSPGDTVAEALQRCLAKGYRAVARPNCFCVYRTTRDGTEKLVCGTNQQGGRALAGAHWSMPGAGFRSFMLLAPAQVLNPHSFELRPTRIVVPECSDTTVAEASIRSRNKGNCGTLESIHVGSVRSMRRRLARQALGGNALKVLAQIPLL